MKAFPKPLDLRFLDDDLEDKPFELLESFHFIHRNYSITVPRGYRTDFASVPKIFHRLIGPIGPHGKAAVIHDWLCDESPKRMDYKEAAHVFGLAMEILRVPKWERWAMVRAVRIGGPRFNEGDD